MSSPADGSGGGSRPSMNNRQGHEGGGGPEPFDPSDVAGGLRPVSANAGTELRDEALLVEDEHGQSVPLTAPNVEPDDGTVKARPWYRVVRQHTDWYKDSLSSHIEYKNPDGETVRGPLENSYQPQYGDRYYAKLMDLKRGIERRWGDMSIVMLTLSASTLDRQDRPRPPADHMRDIREGWETARKQLYHAVDGREWCYARVWEPTTRDGQGPAGYGHMHIAVFVRDPENTVTAGDFDGFMRSYVSNTPPAGWEAHRPDGDAVSVTHQLEEANAATYVSEYIGQYGDDLHERPAHERAFLATAWATETHRVEFDSTTAQDLIRGEEFRRETGLRPEDRGTAESDSKDAVTDAGEDGGTDGDGEGWTLDCLCDVSNGRPNYYTPENSTVDTTAVDGTTASRPKDLGPPPD
jgi:hypothetical protein